MAERRHVIPERDGWAVKKSGSGRASSRHETQADAVRYARDAVRKAGGGEIVIHKKDGRIRDRDTVFGAREGKRIKD